jgi:hypothetical protein
LQQVDMDDDVGGIRIVARIETLVGGARRQPGAEQPVGGAVLFDGRQRRRQPAAIRIRRQPPDQRGVVDIPAVAWLRLSAPGGSRGRDADVSSESDGC